MAVAARVGGTGLPFLPPCVSTWIARPLAAPFEAASRTLPPCRSPVPDRIRRGRWGLLLSSGGVRPCPPRVLVRWPMSRGVPSLACIHHPSIQLLVARYCICPLRAAETGSRRSNGVQPVCRQHGRPWPPPCKSSRAWTGLDLGRGSAYRDVYVHSRSLQLQLRTRADNVLHGRGSETVSSVSAMEQVPSVTGSFRRPTESACLAGSSNSLSAKVLAYQREVQSLSRYLHTYPGTVVPSLEAG